MFRCEGCPEKYNKKRKATKGNTIRGETLFRVITVQRKVRYINQVRLDKIIPQGEGSTLVTSYQDLDETTGTEIVEEKFYCQHHIPTNLQVKILPEVKRKVLVKVKRPDRGEN